MSQVHQPSKKRISGFLLLRIFNNGLIGFLLLEIFNSGLNGFFRGCTCLKCTNQARIGLTGFLLLEIFNNGLIGLNGFLQLGIFNSGLNGFRLLILRIQRIRLIRC